jgi:hypothetical protein
MKSVIPEDEWHSKVATVLNDAMNNDDMVNSISILPLIPLTKGTWVRPKGGSIYFPTYDGVDIPTGLDQLNLVNPDALANQERFTLFEKLKISQCKLDNVLDFIEKRYIKSDPILYSTFISDIKFIYWNHDKIQKKLNIHVMYSNGIGISRNSPWTWKLGWFYSPQSDGPYSAASILNSKVPSELNGEIQFLLNEYYEKLGQCEIRHGIPAIQWFNEYVAAQSTFRLFARHVEDISQELIYTATHRSDMLLGVLQANLIEFPNKRRSIKKFKDFVSNAEIPILNSESKVKVQSTFLPNPDMIRTVKDLGLQEGFGFIKEIENSEGNWRFLEQFGVGIEQDLKFWIAILKKARQQKQIKTKVMRDIYLQIWIFSKTEVDKMLLRYVIYPYWNLNS